MMDDSDHEELAGGDCDDESFRPSMERKLPAKSFKIDVKIRSWDRDSSTK